MRRATTFFLATVCLIGGCTRAKYFARADAEARQLVDEKACETGWSVGNLDATPDPRSRYHDVYSEIRPPMPQDDAESHRYMRFVDGHKGYKHWYRDGSRQFLDNPDWQLELASYCEVTSEGEIELSLPSAVSIARVNSPDIQRQIETVYLSALDVSGERFEFDVQFFAGNDTTFSHLGRLRNPILGERNELITNTDALIRRRFTAAGELLVGFANTFVWQFAGTDTNQAFSLLNFTMVQPLLRGAYRSIAMEDLTQSERTLLANLRALERYHQGFLTNLAVGELGVLGPLRTTADANSFFGDVDAAIRLETIVSQAESRSVIAPNRALTTGFVTSTGAQLNGFLGLMQQYQELRNSRQNLSAQERAVRLLEAHLAAGNIELIRVDEFRQTVEVERNNLIELETRLQNSLDDYKVTKLGLPSEVPVTLDDSLIAPVNLNGEATLRVQRNSQLLQKEAQHLIRGDAEVDAQQLVERLAATVDEAVILVVELEELNSRVNESGVIETLPAPIQSEADPDDSTQPIAGGAQTSPQAVLDRAEKRLQLLQNEVKQTSIGTQILAADKSRMGRFTKELTEISDLIYLTEIRIRLSRLELPTAELDSVNAFGIASLNRLDWMNARASVVDQWRQITLQANRLKSDMDVFVSGDIGTVGNNPAKFRGPTGTLRLGVRFDGALTRLLERNAFRESVIEYQRSRRDLIQFQDTIGKNLRRVLREMALLEQSFEIQRRAVEIAVRRVDVSLQTLNRPPVPAPTGAPNNQLSPNASFSMLTALGDLRSSKDNILSVWLNYQAARLLLARDLGVIGLDTDNLWLESMDQLLGRGVGCEFEGLPPEVIFEELPPGAILTEGTRLDEHVMFENGALIFSEEGDAPFEEGLPAESLPSPDGAGLIENDSLELIEPR